MRDVCGRLVAGVPASLCRRDHGHRVVSSVTVRGNRREGHIGHAVRLDG